MTNDATETPDAPVARQLSPEVRWRMGNPARFMTPDGARVALSRRFDRPVLFTIVDTEDRIQKRNSRGHFYETSQLERIASYMPEGGVFADVGANIGNHSLYMLIAGGASRVMPFEMNPKAIELYLSNIILNNLLDHITLDTLGYGLSDAERDDAALSSPKGNLGWTRLEPDQTGEIPLRTGDALIDGRPVDVLKIDVEGHEIEALSGLSRTIEANRPVIFVEVAHRHRETFDAMMAGWHYRVAESFEPNRVNQNLLLVPEARP